AVPDGYFEPFDNASDGRGTPAQGVRVGEAKDNVSGMGEPFTSMNPFICLLVGSPRVDSVQSSIYLVNRRVVNAHVRDTVDLTFTETHRHVQRLALVGDPVVDDVTGNPHL